MFNISLLFHTFSLGLRPGSTIKSHYYDNFLSTRFNQQKMLTVIKKGSNIAIREFFGHRKKYCRRKTTDSVTYNRQGLKISTKPRFLQFQFSSWSIVWGFLKKFSFMVLVYIRGPQKYRCEETGQVCIPEKTEQKLE